MAIDNVAKNEVQREQITSKCISSLKSIGSHMSKDTIISGGIDEKLLMKSLGTLTSVEGLNLLINSVNLCVTCAGFIIVSKKLDAISSKIDGVLNTVKASNAAFVNYEFTKVIGEHQDMLDKCRLQKPLSEEKMRELVDAEHAVLGLLIDAFLTNTTNDEKGNLIYSIYSMASMLVASITIFDEIYYFNNKDIFTDGKTWHPSYDTWISNLGRLSQGDFVSKIQDYGIFNLNLSTTENDVFYKNLCAKVVELKQELDDRFALMRAFETKSDFRKYLDLINQGMLVNLKQVLNNSGVSMDEPENIEAVNNAFSIIAA